MFKWLIRIFKPEEPEIIDKVTIGPITNPIVLPNDVVYKFPDPTSYRPYVPPSKRKKRRRRTVKK